MTEKVYNGHAMVYFNEQVPTRTIMEKVEVIRAMEMRVTEFFEGFGILVVEHVAGGPLTDGQLVTLRALPGVVTVERSVKI